MTTVPRRRFLQLSGVGAGIGVLARARPGRAGPKRVRSLADRGRAADRLEVGRPPPPGGSGRYHDSYARY
jgi:hypothetical protein